MRPFIAGLLVCVLFPILAASGLALPLPSVVERVAASLVSGSEAVAFDLSLSLEESTGSSIGIVRTSDELAAARPQPARDLGAPEASVGLAVAASAATVAPTGGYSSELTPREHRNPPGARDQADQSVQHRQTGTPEGESGGAGEAEGEPQAGAGGQAQGAAGSTGGTGDGTAPAPGQHDTPLPGQGETPPVNDETPPPGQGGTGPGQGSGEGSGHGSGEGSGEGSGQGSDAPSD